MGEFGGKCICRQIRSRSQSSISHIALRGFESAVADIDSAIRGGIHGRECAWLKGKIRFVIRI